MYVLCLFLNIFVNRPFAKSLRSILLCTALTYCFSASFATNAHIANTFVTTDSVEVFFRVNRTELDTAYCQNGSRLTTFAHRFDSLVASDADIRSILIVSGASPEGSSTLNRNLSDARAKVIRDYLIDSNLIDDKRIEIESRGADWHGLTEFVKRSSLAHKDTVLRVLELPEWIVKEGKIVDSRKNRLKALAGGKIWHELHKQYFADLRHTKVMVTYNILRADSLRRITLTQTTPIINDLSINNKYKIASISPAPIKPHNTFYMAVKTNMLYDVILIPNIGIEFYLGRNWSVSGNWMYAWWNSDRRHNYWRTYGGDLEIRRWISPTPLRGHHFGVYSQILTYDFALGGRGYLGDRWTYGGGISYGYSMPISQHLNIDFTIGIGYLRGKYKEYLPQDNHYVWQSTKMRNWFGPTKAEISLVWKLGKGNNNKKGGAR